MSKAFATTPASGSVPFTLRAWLPVAESAGGFLLATTGLLEDCRLYLVQFEKLEFCQCEKELEESRTGQASKVAP